MGLVGDGMRFVYRFLGVLLGLRGDRLGRWNMKLSMSGKGVI